MAKFRPRNPTEDLTAYLNEKKAFEKGATPSPITPVPPAVSQAPQPITPIQPTTPASTINTNPQDYYKINTGNIGKDGKPVFDIYKKDGQKVSAEEGLTLFQAGLNVEHIGQQGQSAPLSTEQPQAPEIPAPEPITGQYVRYAGSPDVFDSQTGKYISSSQAETIPDLFSKVQDIETPRPDIQSEADFAKKAETNLATYGSSVTPADFSENPLQAFENAYMQMYKNLGLPNIRQEIDNITKQKADLENKRIEAINAVNDNPWLSEALRSRKVSQINDTYDSKGKVITDTLTLYDKLYQRGTQQVEFITKGALDAFQAQQTFDQNQLDKATQRAIQMAQLDISRLKEVSGGLYDTQENKWIVQPKPTEGALPASFKEWQLAGSPGTYKDWVKQEGAELLSVSEAQALGVPYGTSKTEAKGITPTKPPTTSQETTALFANRINNSGSIIDQLTPDITKMSTATFLAQQKLPNFLQSDLMQSLVQAERDFVNAVLRRESGAVISPSEFDNAEKQYFPQPGDSNTVIEQKRKNREIVQQGFIQGAGQAFTPIQPTSNSDTLFDNLFKQYGGQ